jgi:hypothetical protein
MDHNFVFYIHSDILATENFEKTVVKDFFRKIIPILEVGRLLRADVLYSKKDTDILNDYFEGCEEFFSPKIQDRLGDLLGDFSLSKEGVYFFNIDFALENTQIRQSSYTSLDERCCKNKMPIVFTLNLKKEESLMFVKSSNEFGKVEIKAFNNAKDIWQFICCNIDKRHYHPSLKHGNDKKTAIPPAREKVSQLLCCDQEAQELLDTAIFDLREKKGFHYNFDPVRDTFIVFPFEGNIPQNQFHAYHIQKTEWEKEIPFSIRNFFGKT